VYGIVGTGTGTGKGLIMDIHLPGKCLVKVSGSGSSIIGCILIRILGFDDRKFKNIYSFKNIDIF
jgi:hypothetical protein